MGRARLGLTMTAKTNAVRLLDVEGISYRLLPYDLAGDEFSAEAVAAAIGLSTERVFKTLAASVGDESCLAVVPGNADLDLKAVAQASAAKKAAMVSVAELERLTGYRRGSVTALGAKRPLPVVLDESAMIHETIAVSAGREGLQVELAPGDYVRVTGARIARIARKKSAGSR
jgi:Cys-tRNA(Pro)/Cys-tRNA(Cys) deacylase